MAFDGRPQTPAPPQEFKASEQWQACPDSSLRSTLKSFLGAIFYDSGQYPGFSHALILEELLSEWFPEGDFTQLHETQTVTPGALEDQLVRATLCAAVLRLVSWTAPYDAQFAPFASGITTSGLFRFALELEKNSDGITAFLAAMVGISGLNLPIEELGIPNLVSGVLKDCLAVLEGLTASPTLSTCLSPHLSALLDQALDQCENVDMSSVLSLGQLTSIANLSQNVGPLDALSLHHGPDLLSEDVKVAVSTATEHGLKGEARGRYIKGMRRTSSNNSSSIQFELVSGRDNDCPVVCLSHRWVDHKGLTFTARATGAHADYDVSGCTHALLRLIAIILSEGAVVWIDRVCVDQSDERDKEAQLSLVGAIFAQSIVLAVSPEYGPVWSDPFYFNRAWTLAETQLNHVVYGIGMSSLRGPPLVHTTVISCIQALVSSPELRDGLREYLPKLAMLGMLGPGELLRRDRTNNASAALWLQTIDFSDLKLVPPPEQTSRVIALCQARVNALGPGSVTNRLWMMAQHALPQAATMAALYAGRIVLTMFVKLPSVVQPFLRFVTLTKSEQQITWPNSVKHVIVDNRPKDFSNARLVNLLRQAGRCDCLYDRDRLYSIACCWLWQSAGSVPDHSLAWDTLNHLFGVPSSVRWNAFARVNQIEDGQLPAFAVKSRQQGGAVWTPALVDKAASDDLGLLCAWFKTDHGDSALAIGKFNQATWSADIAFVIEATSGVECLDAIRILASKFFDQVTSERVEHLATRVLTRAVEDLGGLIRLVNNKRSLVELDGDFQGLWLCTLHIPN
eukprot:c10966_g1_i1.p1 GENE.c10966_g1_i1~~c10966_g1_i1.p1  ORF type:complete len:795 (-),score=143.73 c10966_g1_i1:53-2437(-)